MFKVVRQFYDRVIEARLYLIGEIRKHPEMEVKEVAVFGSITRGHPTTWLDINLMFLIDGELKMLIG